MMEEPKRHSTTAARAITLHTVDPAPFAKQTGVESVSQSGPRCGSDAWAMSVSSRRSVLVPRRLPQDLRWCHQLTHSYACQNLLMSSWSCPGARAEVNLLHFGHNAIRGSRVERPVLQLTRPPLPRSLHRKCKRRG